MSDQRRLTLARVRLIEAMLRGDGYADMIAWSEGLSPPRDCRAFGKEAVYVICNSGMSVAVGTAIYWRCVRALARGASAATVYGHPGKAAAIDHIWRNRKILFDACRVAPNKLAYCQTLPFVGPITRHNLAKNLGLNTVKPDVHLARFAKAERISAWELCHRLAGQTGYRETRSTRSCGAPAPTPTSTRAGTPPSTPSISCSTGSGRPSRRGVGRLRSVRARSGQSTKSQPKGGHCSGHFSRENC